ncbi:uncharacterized protein [Lolium perenne]|uniref:uncharacterized protein n=1 Tax=Lolium perenne TaxID=4522 RepID=UPI0021F6644D|nr:uncharacterized protein LOC127320046 [Lolium perenne]
MSLRRLLGLSSSAAAAAAAAAAPGRLWLRSLATAATHPPWASIKRAVTSVSSPSACVSLADPPRFSEVHIPEHLLKVSPCPDPDSDVVQMLAGGAFTSSGDGLLLVSQMDLRFTAPILGNPGAGRLRQQPTGIDPGHNPGVARFVFNPLTCQLTHLPNFVSDPVADITWGPSMGILTQTDRGHGPPDRFAVAGLQGHGDQMLRFLSETGEWEIVAVSPCLLPLARPRRIEIDNEALAFGGRLWWFDVAWGAVSLDPFSNRPELSFVELPRGSVLPAGAGDKAFSRGSPLPDADGNVWRTETHGTYRRVGVSQGRLRYVELSQEEPFLLSSFVLDKNQSSWTLEHQVSLRPLQQMRGATRILLIDPLDSNVVHLEVVIGTRIREMVVVDMNSWEAIGSFQYRGSTDCIPCVLPSWLGSSQIPSTGKKDIKKDKTLADVLVRAGTP